MSKCMGVTAPSPLTHSRGGCASATPSARQKGGTERASLSVGGRSAWNEGRGWQWTSRDRCGEEAEGHSATRQQRVALPVAMPNRVHLQIVALARRSKEARRWRRRAAGGESLHKVSSAHCQGLR